MNRQAKKQNSTYLLNHDRRRLAEKYGRKIRVHHRRTRRGDEYAFAFSRRAKSRLTYWFDMEGLMAWTDGFMVGHFGGTLEGLDRASKLSTRVFQKIRNNIQENALKAIPKN